MNFQFNIKSCSSGLLIFNFLSAFFNSFLYLFTDFIRADENSSLLPTHQQEATFITGPYLDGTGITNVTTQISTHAYLPCKVSISLICFYFSFIRSLMLSKMSNMMKFSTIKVIYLSINFHSIHSISASFIFVSFIFRMRKTYQKLIRLDRNTRK